MTAPTSACGVLRIVHHHPGRLRVRADAFVDDDDFVARTKSDLRGIAGIRSVSHEPRTGSLLIEYRPHDLDVNRLIARIAELGGLDVSTSKPLRSGSTTDGGSIAAQWVLNAVRRMDDIATVVTKGRFDLGVLVPGGLAAFGVYSFLRGPHARMPRWDSLVYWAYSVFVRAHAHETRSAP